MRISKFEDSHKYFTMLVGAVRSSRSRGSSTSRSAFKKIFEANHPHHGRQVSTSSLPVLRHNALMSIIKLTDPRYCSPLDSPNTHLSSSKGPASLGGASAFRNSAAKPGRAYRTERIETGTHRWSLVVSLDFRSEHARGSHERRTNYEITAVSAKLLLQDTWQRITALSLSATTINQLLYTCIIFWSKCHIMNVTDYEGTIDVFKCDKFFLILFFTD